MISFLANNQMSNSSTMEYVSKDNLCRQNLANCVRKKYVDFLVPGYRFYRITGQNVDTSKNEKLTLPNYGNKVCRGSAEARM